MKKNKILAIVAVVIGVSLVVWGFTHKETTEIKVGREDWMIYKGEGYTLDHPKDFVLTTTTNGDELIIPVKNYFSTILASEANLTLNDPAPTCPQSQGETFSATTTLTTSSNVKLNKHKWSGVGAGQLYQGVDYSIEKDRKCYQFSLFTHSANGAALYYSDEAQIREVNKTQKKEMEEFLILIDEIAKSFQFTNNE
jgi:hypothetical protein